MDEATPKRHIDAGRLHYEAKRYKLALEQFTLAMNLCPCHKGGRRPRCSCKDFESVAEKNGSIFDEAMYTCVCTVGDMFDKCVEEEHIRALTYRAATFEALGELKRAKKDAEWMLELAPSHPDGYLRLGKVARLQGMIEFAWKVYSAGYYLPNISPSKRQQLEVARMPLRAHFACADPIRLPSELVHSIFGNLSTYALVRSIAVSKTWNQVLTAPGHRGLWRKLAFTSPKRAHAPSLEALEKILYYSGRDVRELIISNCTSFRLNSRKFTALREWSRNLTRLELRHPPETLSMQGSQDLPWEHLEHVFLEGFASQDQDHFTSTNPIPRQLLNDAAASLKSLHMRGTGLQLIQMLPDGLEWTPMPLLTTLRLEAEAHYNGHVKLESLVRATPNVEQLWLQNIMVELNGLRGPDTEHMFWLRLKAVVIKGSYGSRDYLGPFSPSSYHSRRTNMQHFDLDFNWKQDTRRDDRLDQPGILRELDIYLHPHGPELGFQNVSCLRLKHVEFEPSTVQWMLKDSLENKKLNTIDIVFPLTSPEGPEGIESTKHLEKYDWLRGAETLTCIGVYGFRFRRYPTCSADIPLIDFLASFKNLETLEIGSDQHEAEALVPLIEMVLRDVPVKTIYQSQVQGVALENLERLGDSVGVKLVWGDRPRQWPIPEELLTDTAETS